MLRSLCVALLALVLIGCAQQPAKDDSPVSYTHLTLPTICSV